MLVWPFDIVIASEDATFQDNTVAMGICGAEFFNASGGGPTATVRPDVPWRTP